MTIIPSQGQIENGVFSFPVRVYVEDTDAGGIVYHASYVRFMERGRTEWLRYLGVEQSETMAGDDPVTFVVKRMEIDYQHPAYLDDALVVQTWVEKAGGASLILAQEIWRDDSLLTHGVFKVGVLDKTGKPLRMPADMVKKFKAFGRD